MMRSSARAWMLPEGVVEALPRDAKKLNQLEQTALSTFALWGYLPLRPPLMEYADTFIGGEFSDNLAAQTIQIKDQKSGRQLGFRADITPQIARIDAHYLKTDHVARYAYAGEVIRSYPAGHGSARNPSVIGAELLGSASHQADIEIVSLLIEYLRNIQLPEVIIELGNVDVAVELLRCLGVAESQYVLFFEALATKDTERLDLLAKRNRIESSEQLVLLTRLYGGLDTLATAEEHFSALPAVLEEIQRLRLIAEHLRACYPGTVFHIDFSDVHGYGYHNGLIFSAYVKGVWQAVARGGRYDSFGYHLSEDKRPSTGFSCDLNLLAGLIQEGTSSQRVIVCRRDASDERLIRYIRELREHGDIVVCVFDDGVDCDIDYTHQIIQTDTDFVVEKIAV